VIRLGGITSIVISERGSASARGEDVELAALRVGQAHPRDVALAEVDVGSAECSQLDHLCRLIVTGVGPEVEMDAVLHGLGYGLKPWLVVSNNARNRLLDDIIAIRLTTTARDLPTWVKLSPADPLTGYANTDCIEQPGKAELGEYLGALSPASVRAVNQSLAIALAPPA
jgi:mRNA interferase MazF